MFQKFGLHLSLPNGQDGQNHSRLLILWGISKFLSWDIISFGELFNMHVYKRNIIRLWTSRSHSSLHDNGHALLDVLGLIPESNQRITSYLIGTAVYE